MFTYQCSEEHNDYGGGNHCSINGIPGNSWVCELQTERERDSKNITFSLTKDSVLWLIVLMCYLNQASTASMKQTTHTCLNARAMETAPLISPAHQIIT